MLSPFWNFGTFDGLCFETFGRSVGIGGAVRSKGIAVAAVALAFGAAAPAAMAETRFERIDGFAAPGTPAKFNRVGVLKVGPPRAENVLVLNPGASASAAYFAPLARDIVRRVNGWQVWAVDRRENLLEDHSVVNQAKTGQATDQRLFDYYLGYLTKPNLTDHARMIPDSEVPFARQWGMRVEIEDLRRVVRAARRRGGKVVLGGHSLGGSITTAYATWDFGGTPGGKGLSGLVYIDGGSSPTPMTEEEANQSLGELQAGSPWLTFGGIPAPFAGLFNVVASTGVLMNPDGTSELQTWPLLPDNLKPPVPTTNLAQYGFALDTETSPPGLVAAHAHLGRLAAAGARRRWDRAGELTPIRRYARMFSGTGLKGVDGTAWYHPRRLTIDSGAVAAGNPNPAQRALDVRAIHGDDLPRRLRIYAFGASLGGTRVLDAARVLARQSDIPRRNLTLVDREETYAHNDPNSAFPRNDFVARLLPFLGGISRRETRRGSLPRRP
jgi:pimeloyl-ACP methyl ester carboxylesterase